MRCLVVGGGGREHALVCALLRSPQVEQVIAAPGNPGIAAEPKARCAAVSATDLEGLLALAEAESIDLTVVGPEAPLVAGIVDRFRAAGQLILGPDAEAARLEGSKAFCKAVMAEAGVPTAECRTFTELAAALAALPAGPIVVKADGLAGGKGVVVAPDRDTAAAALEEIMGDRRFGEAGDTVLLEEMLYGEEVSVIALCDGERALCFPPAQDHKRLLEGDEGPNTGGMGAYAPAPVLDAEGLERTRTEVILPMLQEMARRGHPFHGFLYAGLMMSPEGPKVLEFNVRFGDPETQPLLSLLGGDPAALFASAARGALAVDRLELLGGAAACVVLAAEGYPRSPNKGDPIEGVAAADAVEGVKVYQAGTRREGEALHTNGGRVLGVTATGADLHQALERAYQGCERIEWRGLQYRRDIGHRALKR